MKESVNTRWPSLKSTLLTILIAAIAVIGMQFFCTEDVQAETNTVIHKGTYDNVPWTITHNSDNQHILTIGSVGEITTFANRSSREPEDYPWNNMMIIHAGHI